MKNLRSLAFLHAVGVVIYTSLVAVFMQNGEVIFGSAKTLLVPVVILLLFVLSAAVAGALVLGRPIMLYFDGQKKEAVKMFIWTVGWLAIIVAAIMMTVVIV